MKLTKSQLKQIIKEEFEQSVEIEPASLKNIKVQLQSDKELVKAIQKLTDKVEELDISIDYLAGATTGQSPLSIAAMQGQMGRGYSGKKVDEIIHEEIIKYLKEKNKKQ